MNIFKFLFNCFLMVGVAYFYTRSFSSFLDLTGTELSNLTDVSLMEVICFSCVFIWSGIILFGKKLFGFWSFLFFFIQPFLTYLFSYFIRLWTNDTLVIVASSQLFVLVGLTAFYILGVRKNFITNDSESDILDDSEE